MTLDQQDVRDALGRVFARRDVLDACRRDHRDVGEILRVLKSEGVSHAVIADLTGIPQSPLDEYSSGRRRSGLDTLERLAQGLDLPNAARLAFGLAPDVYSGAQS